MPAIEPFVPRRQDEPPPRGVRWRFALAAVITGILMIVAIMLLAWLPLF
ncbi:MAG TPA: hypothetical protein VI300_17510 [Solirubrobacter sp.]